MKASLPHAFTIDHVQRESDAGITLTLDGPLPAMPGQFVMVWLPRIDERPFGIMDDDPLRLTIAKVGPFTRHLCSLRSGQRLWVRGPFGHGFDVQGQRLLLVAGGSGAASLTLLAKHARKSGADVTAVVGAQTSSALMLPWRFAELGCQTILSTDDGSAGLHGTVMDALKAVGNPEPDTLVCGCGPEPMLAALVKWAGQRGLSCWVSMERVMKCGLGLCGACHAGDRLICRDGPVLDAATFSRIARR